MSNNITKRQHYVWRNYLRSWSKNDKIVAYHKKNSKTINTDLMNVAQQRYFNKISKLDEIEIQFLEHIVSKTQGPIEKMVNDLVQDMKLYSELKNIQEKITSNVPEALNELEKNGFEQLHTIIENHGNKIIKCKYLDDLKFLDDDMLKYETLMFICFQYFRTKKQKDIQIDGFKGIELNIENIHNILVIINAAKLAQNISFDPNIRYTMLEIINSDYKFITSDQPVINLFGNDKDSQGFSKDLAFYYPISPTHAILVDFPKECKEKDKYSHRILLDKEIIDYNTKISTESHEFIFSDSEDLIKKFT